MATNFLGKKIFKQKYLIKFKNFQKFIFALHATDIVISLQKPANIIHSNFTKQIL